MLMSRLSFVLVLLMCLVPPILSGCGSDDGDGQPTPPDQDTTPVPDVTEGARYEDMSCRLTTVFIRAPQSARLLNSLIAADIADGTLNVLIDMKDFSEPEGGKQQLMITGNAADEVEGGYAWADIVDEIVYVRAEIDGSGRLTGVDTLDLIFPASVPGGEGVVRLPLRHININAQLSGEGSARELQGVLIGAIYKADADEIIVAITPGAEPAPISNVLGERNMNYPDSTNPIGWRLEADIRCQEAALIAN